MRDLSGVDRNLVQNVIAEALLQVRAHIEERPEREIMARYLRDVDFHYRVDLATSRVFGALNGSTTGAYATRLRHVLADEVL